MNTFPLLQSQLGVFMEWIKDPSVTQYNLPSRVHLPKAVDLTRVKYAFQIIIGQRKELRTRFVMVDGEPRQYADDAMQVPIPVYQMTDDEAAQYIEKSFVRPFDLLSGEPLIRIELIEAVKDNWMLVDVHHAIGDGVTLAPNLTIYDLPAAYKGEPLESVEYGMYDYAEDEQQSFGTENYQHASQYYQEKFSGIDFVSLAGNPESHLGNMVRESAFMPVGEVDEWCKNNGITSNLLYMAAFSLVLSRLSREQQVAYYSINHGRMDKRLARAYGMFVKSVPILADVVPEQNVLDFIRGFRRELMSTIRYGVYPFNHFCRDLGVQPKVSFGFQGYAMQEYADLDGSHCTAVQMPKGKIDDDMSCVIYLREGHYDIRMESSDALNSRETLRIVADAIKTVTEYMMAHPDAQINQVPLLSAEAQKNMTSHCQGKSVSIASDSTFPSLFMHQATSTPDAPAVVDEQGTYTYSELNALSGSLGQQLIQLGVKKNHFVSIMLGYQKEFLVAAIGIEKAGGAYVPLDYDYPNDRLLYMLEDSESQVLITSHAIYDEKNSEGEFTAKNILFIDDFLAGVSPTASDAALNLAMPDGLAYMIYTSGSTGKPKGVMISHLAKSNFVQFIAREWGHTGKSRICCHSSFSFDASIEDLYPVLTVGGTLYTVPQEARKDLTLLHDFIVSNGITGGCYTTQLGQMLLQLYPDLPVEYLVVGGEKMTANPDCRCRLINTYGPTEFTVDATFFELKKGCEYKNIPIGRPLDNLAAYVVDAAGHLLPLGMAGELCMAGAQMAAGYWKREDLTAEKFSDIMVNGKQVKVYHTGDLVRYNSDGDLEYMGRIDNQVKLRGFRIELGEIETLIGKYDGIQMESVQVREIGGVQHLCAYYTADREIDKDALKAYLSESLTDYMVPTSYMQLDQMPLTPNGKVNTKALPNPQVEEEELVKPETSEEQQVFELVAGILKHDQFGVTSNLISMGLTSLSAMRLSAQIEKQLGWKVPTKELLRKPTIRTIIEKAKDADGLIESVEAYPKQEYYPITENQRGIYIDWEMNRDALQYNIPEVIRFAGVNAETLCEALRQAVNAHPAMKARLAVVDGDVMQRRQDEEPVEVSMQKLDFEPDAAFFQSRVRPFDLFNDNLYRLEVYQTPMAVYLFIDVYHIIFDGVSSYIFMDDVRRALAGESLVTENYTAYDRAIDEKKWMDSELFMKAEAYFDDLLADADVASYPHSLKPDGGQSGSAHVQLKVLASAIDQYCKSHGFTQNSFFMTALMQVLHRITREKDILITTIDSGREDSETQQITGMFVKTLTVVSSVQGETSANNRSFTSAVEKMQEQFVGTKSLSIYPYTRIVERYQIRPEIMFVYQGGMDLLPEGSDAKDSIILQLDTTKAPIVLMVVPDTDGTYILDIEYSTKLYSKYDMEQLLKAYQTYVKQAPSHADNEKAIKLLSPAAEQKMLGISEGDSIDYPHDETWIDMFLAEVDKHPEQPAVVDATGSLTYAEYNAQSLRLANGLISEGVKPGDVVAIMLPRIKEFFVAVLGIQRAGVAYVPIDMDYPEDRRQYMQEDSGAKIVITTDNFVQLCSKGDETPVNLAKPEQVAYMIYTSGSTGKPKGVPVSHRGIRACAAWNIPTFELKPGKQNLHHPSFSFDASTFDLFYPLAAGATVHLLNEEMRKDMDGMAKYIRDNHITGMTMSTALGMALLNQFDLPIEYIMLGGEKFMPVKKTGAKLFNGYGPTEFTVCSSFHLIDQEKDIDIPIGRAVPNSWSVICDAAGQLLPHGVPGELCLIGDQIAEGYLNRPELTAEKFARCPFMPEKRMYRTGDLARWNNDDELEFMGRIDNQVKLRGFRIELGEIENQASLFEGMLAVIAEVKTKGNNQHLCLYYTAEKTLDVDALRTHLEGVLTDYMVPDVFMQLDEMPMTPNGKINKKALPEPVIKSDVEYVKPEGDVEQKIADLFGEVLGLTAPVGALDSFFALGGDSIKSIRLVSMLRQDNIVLQVADVMKYKTVRALAKAAGVQTTAVDIPQDAVSGLIKPSAIQSYFFHLALPVADHFNQAVILRAVGRVDSNLLQQVLQTLVQYHDMLRLTVKDNQIDIRPETSDALYDYQEKDFTGVADVKAAIETAANQLNASVSLATGPVFKTILFHTTTEDILLLVCHHIAVDGVSWRILIEDLNRAYMQLADGKPVELPRKTHSFSYYTEAISRYRDSYILSREKAYWEQVQEKMAAMPTGNGMDYNRHMGQTIVTLTGEKLEYLLTKASDAYHTDINDLLVTALSQAYRQQTGSGALSIQMEGHGREPIHEPLFTDRTVGWFTSAYPIVVEGISGDMRHDIRLVKETFRAVPNKGLGYGVLQYVASAKNDTPLRTDITPTLGFNYLGEMGGRNADAFFDMADDLPTGQTVSSRNAFGPSLSINCDVTNRTFKAIFEFDTAVWPDNLAQALADVFIGQLVRIADFTSAVQQSEITASDLGAYGWTEQQYEAVCKRFAARGEQLQRVYPLSPMQEAMLLKYQLDPDTTAYRLLSRIAFSVLPTEEAMRNTLDYLAQKHEVLRTSILYEGVPQPCQAIVDRKLGLEMVDLTNEADIEAAAVRIYEEQLHRPLSLQDDPLMRIVCMKTSENSCQLLIVLHHVIVDGWCIPIYMKDLIESLAANMAGQTMPAPEAESGLYEAYIRELLTKDMAAGLGYWRNLLMGYESKAVIPSTGSIPAQEQDEDDVVTFTLTGDDVIRLSDTCSSEQVTLNTAVELAWGLLLQSYNRTEDAVFVKVVSGRNNTTVPVESLVGLFINSVPVRIRTNSQMTVREALRSVQAQAAESSAWDFCPLSDIQQQTDLGSELFQSIVAFENYAGAETLAQGPDKWGIKLVQGEEESFNEISIVAEGGQGGSDLFVKVTFDKKIFHRYEIERMMSAFRTLLLGIGSQPDAPVQSLKLVDAAAEAELMSICSGDTMLLPEGCTFVTEFVRQASETPDSIAVVDKDSSITYAELDRQSNIMAHHLQQLGLKPNHFVGIMLDRQKEFHVSVLGIQKSGAGYLPMDYEYPADRLQYMFEDSEADILITTRAILAEKQAEGSFTPKHTVFIEEFNFSQGDETPVNLATPESRAYMIYTSGSTGKPKGVIIQQKAKINFVKFLARHLNEQPGEHICCYASFSFDASIKDLYPPLTVGATLYLVPTSIRKDMNELTQWLRDNKINGGNYTTKIGELLMTNYELPVRYVMVGGEKLESFPPLNRGKLRLLNSYGPTETTVDVTTHWVDPTKEYDIPIGRPVVNTTAYIIDAQGRLTPRGVPGELCIGGVQLAEGYYNRPELTAKMFEQCPFEKAGNRMYHTGDLCRWNEDGEIEYVGRIDNQVKLRGYRIELGEIESQIAKYDGVMLACVLVKELNGVQNLCAYFTANHQVDIDDLKTRLGESLTEYMVPTIYIQMDEMPMTQNGKINRRALPQPTVEAEDIVAPGTPEEQQLWDFVTKMLKTTNIGVTTNLVSVGLSSIAAMRLSAQLMSNGLKLSAKDILGHPNIRELAGLITEATPEQQLKPHEIRQFYPMNESQRGMFVDWMMNPNALQYNIPSMFKFKDIDIEQLKRAIEAVAEAHPYLKCRLAQQGDDVVQVRNDAEPVHFEIETLTEEPDAKFFQTRIRPFDLLHEPLYRFNAYIYGNMTYLLIDIHHIIGDGSSNYVLAHELERAYRGEALEKETYTAYDRALDEIALMESERGNKAEQFFDNLVGGVDATVYPHSNVTPSKVVYGEMFIDIESANIDAYCKQHSIAPSSFFLTVFHHVLHRVTRDDNTLVYFISNGRSELALNNFFGVLVKTLPTVISKYDDKISTAAENLHRQMQEAISNDFYPFTKMVERHGLKAEILYNYFVDLQTDISLGEHTDDGMAIEWDTAKTPLSITMVRGDKGQYQSMLEYDATLYTKEDMEILNKAFKTFAELCVLPDYEDVTRVPMLDVEAANEVAAHCRGREVSVDSGSTFPSLFMSQASSSPSSPAVIDEQGSYSYAELNALSGALAQRLVEMGVCKNHFVSIMLGYQKEFLVAAIGVEKSGGAYVPLDYDYPNDRLLYMLEDSESQVLITSHAIYDEKNAEGEFTAKNILFIDDFLAGVSPSASDAALNLATPDGLAYMIYTSGSTGKPKGVMISHAAKANFVQFIAREWGHTENSRICCHSSFSFDASIEDLYPVLTVGGTLYTVPQDARKDLTLLHEFILANGITGGCYTTQLGQMLLQLYPDLPVDYLVVGGEKMTSNPACQCRLINTYGPTEFTVDATFYELEKGREYKNIPIGRPLDNLAAYVVDAAGHLLPQGMPGELCMAGTQMASGYWKREDLTAEKFSEISVAGKSVKVYHTGDLVRYNSDGEIEYLGRIDNQVKLRGFRIELGEIETLIGKYDGIQMESVQVREIGGVQHLCAYYTADREIDKDALRDFLAESLTDYMVPTSYMQLSEMPLTPNGKVNTKALPMPSVQTDELVAPVTPTEKALFKLAAEMLKHEQFGITSNLISMGLTSLSAMRFTVAAFNQFGVQIAVKEVMQHPTIHQLSALIDSRKVSENQQDGEGTNNFWPFGLHYYYPITENQRGVFLDWEMNRDTTQYNVPEVHLMQGANAMQLHDALEKVVNAHPYLKTRFVQHEGDVMQIRRDEEPVEILMQTLTEAPDAAFFQSRVRPFDLYHDTLYRFEIYSYNDQVYLFIDIHHSVYDGASSLFLLNDIDRVYKGEEIESETYSAFDFALDELKLMKSEKYAEAENYFKELLEEGSTAVYPRSKSLDKTDDGQVSLTIDGNAITPYCKEQGLTPNSYFLTMLMHVLHAVTREDNIVITTINNGRSDMRMMGIMGMFVKTIPVVSSSADGSKAVVDVTTTMQNQLLETQSRDFYPFTKMVELYGLRPEIMYVYQPDEGNGGENEDEQIRLSLNQTKLPLDISVAPDKDGYQLGIQYDSSLYCKADIENLGAMIKNIAENAPSASALNEIPLLDDKAIRDMVALSKGEDLDLDITMTFAAAFENCASQHPDSLAVADMSSQLTYGELSCQSNVIAHVLIEKGIQANDFVGIMLERTIAFPLAVLAIHKAGAAYVPLDMEYPVERLSFIVGDSMMKVLVTTHKALDMMSASGEFKVDGVQIVYLDDIDFTKGCEPVNLTTPENLAYMIYTSGSTGTPKGVMLHQAGLWNFTVATIGINGLTANDRISSHRSFSFDAHIEDLFPILSVGGSMHIMPSAIRKDLNLIYEFLNEHEITGGGYTTSIARMLLKDYDLKQRFITCGGEALTDVISDKVQIINVYGPTECTDHSAIYHLEKGRKYSVIPIGLPMPNNYCFIVDKFGRLLPKGVEGELCVAGIQVGCGYWKLPEKTSKMFCDCPFVKTDAWGRKMRMYHTGDICRWNSEGKLEYVGRADSQLKLNGYRIEIDEIESVAYKIDGISQVVADVRQVGQSKQIVLYYTLKEGAALTEEEIRKVMESSSLAGYMKPSIYVGIDNMPTTPSGKLNRKALPTPAVQLGETVAAETELEAQLLDIVKELMGGIEIGVTTNLISAGITSLVAMRLSAVIKQRTGFYIPVKDILTHPTIRELVSTEGNAETEERHAWERREYYPITENQRGIYAEWEMNRDTTQYNIPSAQLMPGMEAQQLHDALVKVVNAHSYLKTRFAAKDGDLVQLRLDDEPAVVDMVTLDFEPGADYFQSLIKPFDLYNDRLYRLQVCQTPTAVYLFSDIHHIIYDGASSLVFSSDLNKAYHNEELNAEEYTSFDNSLDEKEKVSSEEYKKAEAYFDGLLQDTVTTIYPHMFGELDEGNIGELHTTMPREQIDAYCRKCGVTPHNFMAAALALLMHRITREEKVMFTGINNGRDSGQMMNIIGMFVKTLPIVSKLEADQSVVDFVKSKQQQFLLSQQYNFYPFTQMVLRHHIHPEVILVFQNDLSNVFESVDAEPIDLHLDAAKLPISVLVTEAGKDFTLSLEYIPSIYSMEEMKVFGEMFKAVCLNMVTAEKVSDVALTTTDNIQELLTLSAGRQLEMDRSQTFVSMFKQHAAQTPDAVAVVDADGQLTYGELDKLSDALAHRLIDSGVVKNDFVGIMLKRRKEFLVCVLAIQKAGAAYIPLDMEYPAERLAYMLEDSRAKAVVTAHFKEHVELQTKSEIIYLDEVVLKENAEPVDLSSPEGLAYMIYTSGSTGKPKGVMLPHRALRAYLAWRITDLHLDGHSINAQHASFSFDASLDDLLCPLAAGGQVHLLSEELRKDLEGMVNYLTSHKVTGMTLSTQLGMTFVNQFELPLEYMMMGGEKMLPLRKTNLRVINGYGPTEFSVCSSYHVVDQDKDTDIPIGRPVPNSYSFICDEQGNLLPQGVIGELCLSGDQMAKGYWNRPEQTAEKFVECKFMSGKRMYRTGDLARYNADGELEYCGRIDNQVKLRGFRIEFGEIETCAKSIEGIQAVIADVKTINDSQHLVLYYTANREITFDEFFDTMSETLASYMIPEAYVRLESMPMTPNGKIDRKQLPTPEIKMELECVKPSTKREEQLFAIASELLGRDDFGVTDNLMRIGMTSLLAIRMVLRASKEDINIKVDDFLRTKSIRGVLSLNQKLMSWAKEPEADKPVAVLVQGETRYNDLLPYIEKLDEKFNVLVVEAITTHFKYLFKEDDINEAIEFYFTLLDVELMQAGLDKVALFTGHCFGADLCYRLACRWQQEHPQEPLTVCMLDSFWVDNQRPVERPVFDYSHLPEDLQKSILSKSEEQGELDDMYLRLDCHGEPAPLNGAVLLISAARKENIIAEIVEKLGVTEEQVLEATNMDNDQLRKFLIPQREVDNVALWKQFRSDLLWQKADGDHMSMLHEECVASYIQFVFDNVK